MVSCILKYGFALLSFFLATVLVVGLWLIWSPVGSVWLLRSVASIASVEFSFGRIDGRLMDGLQLEELRLKWPDGTVVVEHIVLDWSILQLFAGELQVAELSVSGVDILLDDPAQPGPAADSSEPLVFAWPQVSGWPRLVSADISVLRLDRLVIRTPSETLWQLEHLHGRIRWEDGALSISDLDFAANEGTLQGWLSADLVNSHLGGELQAGLTESIADVDRAVLKFDLGATDSRSLAGQLESLLFAGDKAWFDVSALVELEDEYLNITRGEIRFPGHPDLLKVQGRLHLSASLPWQATVQVEGLDLSELAGVPLLLFGQVRGEGDMDEYRGSVDAENRVDGWLNSRLRGSFDGGLDGIGLTGLNGDWLGGGVKGDLSIGWSEGFSLQGTAQGRDFDLAELLPEWPGRVNLDLAAELRQVGDAPLSMHFSGNLLDSLLHDKELAGGFDILLQGDEIDVARLDLHGEGIDLSADGRLSQRLNFAASANRLSGLVPGLDGQMNGTGWLNLNDGQVAGFLALQGSRLSYGDFFVDRLRVSADKSVGEDRFNIAANGEAARISGQQVDSFTLALEGSPAAHGGTLDVLTSFGNGWVELSGGYEDSRWSGNLTGVRLSKTLFGDWALTQPAGLQVDARSVQLAPMKLVSPQGEAVELDGVMALTPLSGVAQLQWHAFQLNHADPWLNNWTANGTTSGDVQLHVQDGDLLELTTEVSVVGGLAKGEYQLDLADGLLNLDWNRRGLTAQARADFGDMGVLAVDVSSPESARQALPSQGDFSVQFDGLSLSRLYPLGPESFDAEGILSGVADGGWENGLDVFLDGKAEIAGGRLKWQEDEGTLTAELQQASVDWNWRDDSLSGNVHVVLTNHGRMQGEFQLPIPARWPFAIEPEGAVRGKLSGYLQEKGLLTSLFPGSIRETSGQLDFNWTLGGLWSQPDLGGHFSLLGASAYLPAAGVQLKDVGFTGRLSADRIFLDSMSMESGAGRLEGSGEVQLADWRPKEYHFQVGGKNFQLVNLPELQLTVDPDLQLSGNSRQVKLRGSITIPEALIAARNAPSPVASSPDLVIVDAETIPPPKILPVALDARVRILMGDHVLVKANGIDARLGGEVELQASSLDEVTAQGKIHVAEGAYSAYGIGLNIERGNLFFAGGPVDRPTLDILALRKAGEVKAGVQVTGTPRQPVVKLYSEPLMPDTDILAYIVLGRPLGSDSGQSDLLMTAAGALLSKGESSVLQDRLKRRLGLDVLEVQAGSGDVASSMVTIGKYLSPKLYISLGHALFANTNEFRMRYSLTERWELESNVGLESGADLYYRIEFD